MCLTLMWHLRLSFLVNESEQNGHLSIWGKWLIRWCQRLVTVFPQRRHMKWTEEARWNNVSYSRDTLPDPRPNPTPATDPQFVLFLCYGLGLHTVHSCVYKMFTWHAVLLFSKKDTFHYFLNISKNKDGDWLADFLYMILIFLQLWLVFT